jgi:hypothetical protein
VSPRPVPNADRLAIRWTVGDVRERGFEMLRLSIACAAQLFGPEATYLVCVNSLPVAEAQRRTGPLPANVAWREVTRADLPSVLRAHFDDTLIEGMGWKLVPLRTHPGLYELALDNDCILWDLPEGMEQWLRSPGGALFAEDVDRCLGSFDALCVPGNLNAGIRGLAPGLDLAPALETVLHELQQATGTPLSIVAEIEEQGLQAAAISRFDPLFLVRNTEVTICSPFWPRSPELGTCGAHFVGMNARHIPWNYYDRPADLWLDDHWARHRPALYARAGLPLP